MRIYGPRIIAGIAALALTVVMFGLLEPAKLPIPKKAEIVYFHIYRGFCALTGEPGSCPVPSQVLSHA
jgi:hypothetical protein